MVVRALSITAASPYADLEENLYIAKDGYLETILVTKASEDVWFDDFMVMGMSSPVAQGLSR